MEVLASAEDVAPAMKDGLRLEAAAWKGEAGTAIRSDPNAEKFYCEFARSAAHAGWLRLVFLRLGGQRISFDYVLDYGNSIYGIKIGYDPTYRPYSPGHTLLNLILRDACAAGRTEYDFLGVADEWKLRWTSEARPHSWLFLFRRGIRANLVHTLKFQANPWIRRLAGRLRARMGTSTRG
jgi:hypothetical protein